ncbi:hemin uptake protein HemP [Kiloniella sp.]
MSAKDLMQNSREIVIEYQGNDYRLRITSNEKLILTK